MKRKPKSSLKSIDINKEMIMVRALRNGLRVFRSPKLVQRKKTKSLRYMRIPSRRDRAKAKVMETPRAAS